MPKALRRIAPPCIDLMADHFLANAAQSDPAGYLPEIKGFPGSCESLENYEAALHETLAPHLPGLSDNASRFFKHAKHTKLFSAYRHFERTARGVQYVCERLSRADAGQEMIEALAANSCALQSDFTNYWPALCAEAGRFITSEISATSAASQSS